MKYPNFDAVVPSEQAHYLKGDPANCRPALDRLGDPDHRCCDPVQGRPVLFWVGHPATSFGWAGGLPPPGRGGDVSGADR